MTCNICYKQSIECLNKMKFSFLSLLSVLILPQVIPGEKLVVIGLDGFRWDYISQRSDSEVPNFKKFVKNGVTVDYVEPIFPSLSFPSWTTISTGKAKFWNSSQIQISINS